MKRSFHDHLLRIQDFSLKIQNRMLDMSKEDFISNDMLQESIMYCLGQIGEIANNITEKDQENHPQLFWDQMIGLRNRLFHDYEEINFSLVYDITQEPINQLIKEIKRIIN